MKFCIFLSGWSDKKDTVWGQVTNACVNCYENCGLKCIAAQETSVPQEGDKVLTVNMNTVYTENTGA